MTSTAAEGTVHFPDGDKAHDYILRAETDVRDLSKKKIPALRALFAIETVSKGQVLVLGGPVSKDEYVTEIIHARWPFLREAYEVRASSVAVREREERIRTLTRLLTCGDDALIREAMTAAGPHVRGYLTAMIEEIG